jgi:type I restriction enzyme, S subunit
MNWPTKQVSQLCLLAVDCVNKTAPRVEYETPYKMIRTTNVKGGFIYLDDVGYVTEDVFEKWTRRSKPKFGDVILTREAPVGEVGRFTSTDESIFLGQRLFHYRPNPDLLDWNFLAYALQSHEVQGRLRAMGFGATVEHIKVGDAENLLIPCPPVDIQRKIGEILANYDDLIENNRRRMTLLEQSARLLYEEWFVRLRFPGHEHTRIVDGVPEGWEKRTAYDSINVMSGGTPKTTNPDFWDGDIPFYTPKDSIDNAWITGCERNITELGLTGCNSKLYPKGTVFISARGTVGKINIAQRPMAMSQSCYAMSGKYHLTPYFVYVSMSAAVGALRQQAVGAVFDAIVIDTFKRINLMVPSVEIMRMFDEIVQPVFAQVENITLQNQKLRAARDLLLPRLMSGELVA